jgi:hypothetical protein
MTLDHHWKRALAHLLCAAYYGDVSLVDVWSAIMHEMPEEYQSTDEKLMESSLQLLRHCLEEGYLVAGEPFPIGPLPPDPPPGLPFDEQMEWQRQWRAAQGLGDESAFGWRPWDMGYSEALKKIAREWRGIAQPFAEPTAMYCIVTLVRTSIARWRYDRLKKELKLDEEKDED